MEPVGARAVGVLPAHGPQHLGRGLTGEAAPVELPRQAPADRPERFDDPARAREQERLGVPRFLQEDERGTGQVTAQRLGRGSAGREVDDVRPLAEYAQDVAERGETCTAPYSVTSGCACASSYTTAT